jgi:hypothetical protein
LTFSFYQELALGQLGWTPDVFYNSTPRELKYALRGFHELYQQQQRQDWERTRWSTTLMLNIHLEKKNRLSPKDLAVFPWEKTEQQTKLTTEQAKSILARWQKER